MRRLLALAAIVSAALIVFGIPGCGKKSTQPQSSTGSTVPVSSGTWELTLQITSATGNCSGYTIDTKDTLFIDNGLDDFFNDDCNYVITGSRFTHACTETLFADSACVAVATYDGGGTFAPTSFNATFTFSFVNRPPGCSFYPDCVLHVSVTGRRIGAEPQVRIGPAGPKRMRLGQRIARRF